MSIETVNYNLNVTIVDDLRQALIQFTTFTHSAVALKVMNAEDREVRILLNEQLAPGRHGVPFNFGSLSGDYVIRLSVNLPDAIDIENKSIHIKG